MRVNSIDNINMIPRPTYAVIDLERFASNIELLSLPAVYQNQIL